MKLKYVSLLFILFTINGALVLGQTSADKPLTISSNESGELHSAYTDSLAAEAQETGKRLFVIVRLGTGETSKRVSYARLYNTRQYIQQKNFGLLKPVFAEGERVEGEGRIEYYLGSELRVIAFAPRNKTPNLTCCIDYFPPTKSKRQRRKLKKY